MHGLVADFHAARFFACPAGVPPAPGAAVDVPLTPGAYELRVVGGTISVNQGSPIGESDLQITAAESARLYCSGSLRVAATGGAAASRWVLPLVRL